MPVNRRGVEGHPSAKEAIFKMRKFKTYMKKKNHGEVLGYAVKKRTRTKGPFPEGKIWVKAP